MDYQAVFYFVERVATISAAVIFVYLGYRLFTFGVSEGISRFEASSNIFKLAFSGAGPGLLFMAFGGVVLVFIVQTGGYTKVVPRGTPDVAPANITAANEPFMGSGPPAIVSSGPASGVDDEAVAAAAQAGKTILRVGRIKTPNGTTIMTANLPPMNSRLAEIYRKLKNVDVNVRIEAIRAVDGLDYYQKSIFFFDFLKIKETDPDSGFRREAHEVFERIFVKGPTNY